MTKRKRTKGQTIFYKTLHKKRKIEQHNPHKKTRMYCCAPERRSSVPAPLVTPVALLDFIPDLKKKRFAIDLVVLFMT
jgi:hypothetical protein